MRRLCAGLAAAAAVAAISGCVSLLPTGLPVQLYQFGQTPASAPAPAASTVGRGAGEAAGVVLASVELPRSAAGDTILTTRGAEAAYIGGARWLAPAEVLMEEATVRAFRARSREVKLLSRGETGASVAVLRLTADSFDAAYPTGGGSDAPPMVEVALHASLSRADGRAVVERDFAVRQPAAANRVTAIVAAYDAAVAQALAELVDWTDAEAPRLATTPLTPTGGTP